MWVNFTCLPFTATLSPVLCPEVRPIGTALPVRRTVIGRQCNSVETAQPRDRTTNPGIVMPECFTSSQRVDSLARVVITPVRHTHTRLHCGYVWQHIWCLIDNDVCIWSKKSKYKEKHLKATSCGHFATH